MPYASGLWSKACGFVRMPQHVGGPPARGPLHPLRDLFQLGEYLTGFLVALGVRGTPGADLVVVLLSGTHANS